ncbi:MAG: tetratricopeptide repeat protein [Myxococcales bacterium]|nr:tetratricopeptide repeat protein [Myxococcales bacterium]
MRCRLAGRVSLFALFAAVTAPSAVCAGSEQAPVDMARHDARAVKLHREAMLHFAGGRYQAAITAFERALAIEPHPNTLYGIGEAYRRLGQLQRSYHYYALYAATLTPQRRRAFAAKLARLRAAAYPAPKPPRRAATRQPQRAAAAPPAAAWPVHALPRTATTMALRQRAPAGADRSALLVGVTLGPTLSAFGDERLSLSAGLSLGAEVGVAWRVAPSFAIDARLQLLASSLHDAVVDDDAAFVSLAATVGARVTFGARWFVAMSFGIGPSLLIGASAQSFLVSGSGGSSGVLAGILVRPSAELGLRLWRGLEVALVPALDYSPRAGGFSHLAPDITSVTRYHLALAVRWRR